MHIKKKITRIVRYYPKYPIINKEDFVCGYIYIYIYYKYTVSSLIRRNEVGINLNREYIFPFQASTREPISGSTFSSCTSNANSNISTGAREKLRS